MRSVLLTALCLLVGVVCVFSPTTASADDQVYRSIDEAAGAAAKVLLKPFMHRREHIVIAVAPFPDIGTEIQSPAGSAFGEALAQALGKALEGYRGTAEIVERTRITQVQEEKADQLVGLLDPVVRGQKLGELVGATHVVVGDLERKGEILRTTPRVVTVDRGVRVAYATVEWGPPPPHKKTPTWQIILGLLGLWQLLGGGHGGGPEAPAGFNVVIQ